MTYKITVEWGKVRETFDTASDYGREWAETRAIAAFLHCHPEFEKQLNCHGVSFKERARVARKLGLTVKHEKEPYACPFPSGN